jgi:hypothetical protein
MQDSIIATTSAAVCKLNGQIVPCAELAHKAGSVLKWGFGGLFVVLVVFAFITVFWIMMMIHAIKYPIEHKPVWILIMLLTGIIGAVIYYFAVKKDFQNTPSV